MKSKPVFFDDLLGLISAARLISKTRNVSLAEASDFLERLLINDGTVIYTKVAGYQVNELGEAWYAPACDYVSKALSNNWWGRPESLDEPLQPLGFLRDELAISNIDAVRLFELVRDSSEGKTVTSPGNSGVAEITGPTFSRLQRAIAAFPDKYPGYQERTPKLDDDIRPWLKEVGLAESDAERRVFGAIIREHFQLLPDTLKT